MVTKCWGMEKHKHMCNYKNQVNLIEMLEFYRGVRL